MLDRAYALLSIKALDPERRRITGIASTPTPDRQGDVIEPLGATFANPLPLLLHHDRERPVGRVTLTATAAGIAFDATLPDLAEPGVVRDRVNEAWHLIKAGLLTGVSIGFRPLANGVKQLASGGMHLLRTEICELSLVTIPANVETTIHTIKSFDAPHLAASGLTPPGVTGLPTNPRPPMALPAVDHIRTLETKRAEFATRMGEIMHTAAAAGETLAEAAATEHDDLSRSIKTLDADLARWRELERVQMASAAPVPPTPAPAAPVPPLNLKAYPQVSVRPNVPPGTAFVRAACAKVLERTGQIRDASEYAKRWDDSTPEVALFLKAAIAPGTITDATWASPLVNQNVANEFLELLRPATILGKIPGLRNVPFNTKVPSQTAGGTYGWVGESKPKPVTKLAFSSTSLEHHEGGRHHRPDAGTDPALEPERRSPGPRGHDRGDRAVPRQSVHRSRRGGGGRRQSRVDHERRADGGGDDQPDGRHPGARSRTSRPTTSRSTASRSSCRRPTRCRSPSAAISTARRSIPASR